MTPAVLQLAALVAAFWAAVALYRGRRPGRFVAALALGALLAHLGWALLHLPAVSRHPRSLLDVSSGYSVLFVPLGPLLLCPGPAALATLPLAFACARLGCLAAGCCHAPGGAPMPCIEIAGLVGLHALVSRLPARRVVPAVLSGTGLLRLATEPWRAAPPLGEPWIDPAWVAGAWVAIGAVWRLGAGSRRRAAEAVGVGRREANHVGS